MRQVFQDEAQFLAWGDGPAGPWIKLLLPNSDDLSSFRGMTAFKKGMAGQRLAVVIMELADDEHPVEQDEPTVAKGGELAKLAGRLCADAGFRAWLRLQEPAAWAINTDPNAGDEAAAATVVRTICGVQSRAELDHNRYAAQVFHERIRRPWHDSLEAHR